MYRKIYDYLKAWKEDKYRKPLILQGAKNVGKTHSVLTFGKEEYENIAYFNFETDIKLKETFDENITPDYLIPILSRISNQTIIKEKTLIFFDEIQLCERALTSLKYFYEQAPEYHIIAVGNLLEVALCREVFSFPVGKVDIKTLYPMDFEEFLIAMDEEALVKEIKTSFIENKPMPQDLHNKAMDYYKKYLFIGGIPNVLIKYIDSKEHLIARICQVSIMYFIQKDMRKYNTKNEHEKTILAYDNVKYQLLKENKKFKYSLLNKSARAKTFENAIDWLILSGLNYITYGLEKIQKPLNDYKLLDTFKLYFNDIGLFNFLIDLSSKEGIFSKLDVNNLFDLNNLNDGIVENYVNIHLNINGYTNYFYKDNNEKIDINFIIMKEGKIIPILVNPLDKKKYNNSLNNYIKKYNPEYAIKITNNNFGNDNNNNKIKTIPQYAVFCI